MLHTNHNFSFARAMMILPAVLLVFVLNAYSAFAQDDQPLQVSVPSNPIEDFIDLDESMNVDVGLQNPNSHAIYYRSELSPKMGFCSHGLETPEGIVFEGQSVPLNGMLDARCFEQPGDYNLNLRITRISGPNDPGYQGNEVHDVAIKMHVMPSIQSPSWTSRFTLSQQILQPNEAFTQTLVIKNNFPVSVTKPFTVEITNFHYATDGSNFPQVSTGSVHVSANQEKITLLWTGELANGEVATMTVLSAASPFLGDYPGSLLAKFIYGDAQFGYPPVILARGINVIKEEPQPALEYTLNVTPTLVQSSGVITAVFHITNTTSVTQTANTSITLDAGIEEVISIVGPGEVIGFGSTNDAVNAVFSNMTWNVDVPPSGSVELVITAKVVKVNKSEEFNAIIWGTPQQAFTGSFTVFPVISLPPQITSAPATATVGSEVCLNGSFPETIDIVRLSGPFKEARGMLEVIDLMPVRQSQTEVCFSTAELGSGWYGVRVMTNDGRLSNSVNIELLHSDSDQKVFMPLINR